MRKSLLLSSLVALLMFASASDALAQVYMGRGYYPYNFTAPGNYGGRGYYSIAPYYGGYSPYYLNGPGFYSYNPGMSYYYGSIRPIMPTADARPPAYSDARPSGYSDPNAALITVLVPTADAQVWFDDRLTVQQGTERLFTTPPLQETGTYVIKVQRTANGFTTTQQRQVSVQPGQSVRVDFRTDAREPLPAPGKN